MSAVIPIGRARKPRTTTFEVGDHVELARTLVADLGGPENLVHDEGALHRFEADGLWRPIVDSEASRAVQDYSGTPTGPNGKPLKLKAADVGGVIKLAHDQVARPGFFADALPGLAFTNGFVRVTTSGAELLPLTREHRARAGYSFAFERGACPRQFLAFLHDIFRDDEDRAEKEMLVQEFFGACAIGVAAKYQKAMVGRGEGGNGKGVLAKVMIESMPPGTTSAIAPQDLGQDYKRAMLAGVRLNAPGELPERDILDSEAFKAVVAGDLITARVVRERAFQFRPIAGHYLPANRLPITPDHTDGFWRRLAIADFNRSFEHDPNRDPNLAERIIADELPAIVSWLIEGAVRLLREGSYTMPASHHAALASWRKNADPVALFVESTLRRLGPDEPTSAGIGGASLYSLYTAWCSSNGHRPLASNRLAERMKGLKLEAKKTSAGMVYPVARVQAVAANVQSHSASLSGGGHDA